MLATSISNFSFLQGGWPAGAAASVAEAAGAASVLFETVIILSAFMEEEVVEVVPLVNSLSKWGDEAANEGETLDGVFIVDPLDQMLGAHAGPLKKNIFFISRKKNYYFFLKELFMWNQNLLS